MKRVLVCGGRGYGVVSVKKPMERPKRAAEKRRLCEVLGQLTVEIGTFVLISGGAAGADTLAANWAFDSRGFPKPLIFKAEWENIKRPGAVVKRQKGPNGKLYDALAGHVRNQKMIDEGKPDLVVAFPGGTGTADMISRAESAGIEIRRVA